MKIASRSGRQGRGWYAHAVGLVRPGAEAILLAGVALGCAQIGWRIVSPEPVGPASPDSSSLATTQTIDPIRSPFSARTQEASAASNPALASIQLIGVRMSEQVERSGAVLNLGDGLQRPFMVGFEIVDGVRLAEVASDHIVVAYDDGEQTIMMDRPAQSGSFALALMGAGSQPQQMASNVPATTTSASAKDASAKVVSFHPVERNPSDVQWLVSTLANVETRDGAPFGWRVAAPPPGVSADTGLQAGDLVLSVNGARPGAAMSLASLASADRIELSVERRSGERISVTIENSVPS
jgi:type II secretory pathway component PulC